MTQEGTQQIERDDPFERFATVFPQRAGGHDLDAARTAWRAALQRAPVAVIIKGAAAHAEAMKDRPPRFVMSMRRWLQESRWRDAHSAAPASKTALIWIALDTPEWRAWAAFYRRTKGKTPPLDMRGGWRFPSRFPPEVVAAE
jgi:hypothetical protein